MNRSACLLVLLVWLAGCALLQQQREQRTAERTEAERVIVGPVHLSTPLGPVEAGPVSIERRTIAVESAAAGSLRTTTAELPAAPLAGAASGGAGWIAGLLGAAVTAVGWWRARSQRDQLIRAVEHAREVLPEELDARFTAALASRQTPSLRKRVAEVTDG